MQFGDGGCNNGGNPITEIKGLGSLTNLKELRFWENQIGEIKGLENLMKLEILDLAGNKIKEIKGLDNLINLKVFSIYSNQIREFKGLDSLQNLEFLDLSYNEIKEIDLEAIEKLPNLKYLGIFRNPLSHNSTKIIGTTTFKIYYY